MTDYSYSITDATLAEIREIINRTELENVLTLCTSSFKGDGVNTRWYVGQPGYYIFPDDFSVTVDGISAAYTLDSETGIVTMTSIPAEDSVGVCRFTAVQFTDFAVDAAINAAIQDLYPAMYVPGTEEIVCDSDTFEYEVTGPVEAVISVDYRSGSSGGWTRQARRRYRTYLDGTSTMIQFFTAPSAGTLRVHTVSRPGTFTDESSALSSLGLPARALRPIISGAVYRLILNKSAVRIRTDVAVATMGTGTVFPSMMAQVASNWMMRFQFELDAARMRPWMLR